MTEFGASGTLTIESVEGAPAAIEQEVSRVGSLDVTAQPPSGGVGTGALGSMTAAAEGQQSLLEEQVALQQEMLDELQGGGGIGGGGGGGGGAGAFGGGLARSFLGGAAGTAAAGIGTAAGLLGGARHAMGQGWLGQAGQDTLGARTNFQGLDGIDRAMDDPLGAAGTGFKNMIDPTGLGETFARSAATELTSQTTLDEELVSGMQRGVDVWEQELSSIPDPFEGASWPEVDPMEGADWPDLPDPGGNYWPQLPEPGRSFWPDVPTPGWLDALTGGGDEQTPSQQRFGPRPKRSINDMARDSPAVDITLDGIRELQQQVDRLERAFE
ncbi:hypothetical protein [Haloarcula salina]|uniref:Uncharacterized protein n=1 Tax=Haloarcula salina TaxID=1429914 RepID=A0AA41FWM1_9EURY|nr:hypothetical protein [Haloarcula salina]MBV0900170.1 hypothetical protein [Haloarcula salina]